jgi:PAS domain S-box-containing protein
MFSSLFLTNNLNGRLRILPGPNTLSRGQRAFLFLALALFLTHAALLLALPSNPVTPLLSNLIQIACPLLAALACLSVARRMSLFGKHFWLLVAAGFVLWTFGQTVATYYDSILHASLQQPWPSDIIYSLSMSPLLMTLFIDQEKGFEWRQWPRIFDLAQVLILMLAVYLFIFETPEAWQNGWGTIGQLAWVPEIARDLVLLAAVGISAVRGRSRLTRYLYRRMAVFLLVYLSCEFPYLYLQSTRNLRTGSLWDLCWSLPFAVAMAVAALADPRQPQSPPGAGPGFARSGRWSWTQLASLIFPLIVLLMAAGIAERQLLTAAILVVLSFGCSVARIVFAENQQARSAKALQESNALLQSVFEGTGDALFIKDLSGRYMIVNQTFADLLDLAVPEVTGKSGVELVDADLARQLSEQDRVVVESATPQTFEYEVVLKNGSHTFLTHKAPHRDADGIIVGVIGVVRDITEYRHMEERLRQSQKMEAIGTLAGGVAHDFNNLLMVISGYSSVLADALTTEPKLRAHVDQILKAGERAASLTRQLLAFSRKQTIQPAPLNLNQIIMGIEKLLHRLIGEDLKISTHLAPDLGAVLADPGQMEQVILNLAVNARDAMPDGGQLIFETRNVELGDTIASANSLKPGRYIEFLVKDTGMGMDVKVQTRVFEPFFTTKPTGKGTGLGLSTVYGIMRQANGHISFTSQPGCGTTFRIFLPRIDLTQPASPRSVEVDSASGGRETVLLVEDDYSVRELIRAILDSHGYTVIVAAGPRQAEELFDESGSHVNLLVSDVVLPDISGTELAKRLAAKNPRMKVLFMSGYIGDAIVRSGIQEQDVAFLQKPFAPITLVRKVREVLDGTRVGEA